MTEQDKEKIAQWRMMGLGYKAIANRLGVSRDSVKSYCKYHGLAGSAEAVKLNQQERIENKKLCPVCGNEIERISHKGREKRFCSDKCRSAWWSKNYQLHKFGRNKLYKIVCAGCGKEFVSYSNKTRKYCSRECYIKTRFGGHSND